ncbi:MAG: hypothetical protein M1511_04415 [Deltaproteobacteria bacterium]|nr:hypothetical protein [Deltaproteobacteria bacterium]
MGGGLIRVYSDAGDHRRILGHLAVSTPPVPGVIGALPYSHHHPVASRLVNEAYKNLPHTTLSSIMQPKSIIDDR